MTSSIRDSISVVSVMTADLDEYPPTREIVIEGTLAMRAKVLWTAADGTSATGIWQCPPVKLRLQHPFDETFVVLDGRVTVTPEDGVARELTRGDAIVLPCDSVNVWQIHETVTKLFAVHHASGLPFSG